MIIDTTESIKARLEAIQAREHAVKQDCLRVVYAVAAASLRALQSGSHEELRDVVEAIAEAIDDGC
jgi:hypothetical protein